MMARASSSCFALVPCAGSGSRSGAALPKQYVEVAGRALVAHTLQALQATEGLDAVLVVLAPDDELFQQHAPEFGPSRGWVSRCGGATRAATVTAGLQELRCRGASDADWVLVHDAARALVRPAWVERLMAACRDDPVGGLLALPLADTLKRDGGEGVSVSAKGSPRVAATIDRRGKWVAQTPQMFRLGLLERALEVAGAEVTDESSAIEALGLQPRLVPGAVENLKVTWPEDFDIADRLLRGRKA